MSDGAKVIIPEDKVPGKPLGRHLFHDPGNRDYPIRPLLGLRGDYKPRPLIRPWWSRPIFEQGGSSCTAQADIGLTVSVPFRHDAPTKAARKQFDTEEERHALYLESQKWDPWEGGEPQYEGSSTDAPLRVLRDLGVIDGWRWCFGLQDVLDCLDYWGPVAVGTTWKRDMDTPDNQNRIFFRGEERGGHAWDWEYNDRGDKEIVAVNSWGKRYGKRGRVRVPYAEAEKMLEDNGEAVTIVLGL